MIRSHLNVLHIYCITINGNTLDILLTISNFVLCDISMCYVGFLHAGAFFFETVKSIMQTGRTQALLITFSIPKLGLAHFSSRTAAVWITRRGFLEIE